MQFEKISKRLYFLDELIKKEATGSPVELAKRLGVSRRMIFNYLEYLASEKSISIIYCKRKKTYLYQSFRENLKP
jgi:transcriptional antiterminator